MKNNNDINSTYVGVYISKNSGNVKGDHVL